VKQALVGPAAKMVGPYRLTKWHRRRKDLATLILTTLLHFLHLCVQYLHRLLVSLGGRETGNAPPTNFQAFCYPMGGHLPFQVQDVTRPDPGVGGVQSASIWAYHLELVFPDCGVRGDIYQYCAMVPQPFVK
jgi:hypothetical protein